MEIGLLTPALAIHHAPVDFIVQKAQRHLFLVHTVIFFHMQAVPINLAANFAQLDLNAKLVLLTQPRVLLVNTVLTAIFRNCANLVLIKKFLVNRIRLAPVALPAIGASHLAFRPYHRLNVQ